jgi:polyisoprenoid-binding protein YceI
MLSNKQQPLFKFSTITSILMKKIFVLTTAIFLTFTTFAQRYIPKKEVSSVTFAIKNFGLTVNGSFTGLQGSIEFNPAKTGTSNFNVSVDAGTINTDNGSRDSHLKKPEYFNVAAFPKITIVSNKITNGSQAGSYLFEGVATIKGTAKNISFPFTAAPAKDGYEFVGSFKLNRRDFKVGGSSLILSDMLLVNLKVAAIKG